MDGSTIETGLPAGPVWDAARAERNWLLVRLEPRDGKLAKVPTLTGRDTVDRAIAACLTFDQASAKAASVNLLAEGCAPEIILGYFPRAGSAMRAIDLDGCVAPDRTITGPARELLDSGAVYATYSPSGTGIRGWVAANEHSGKGFEKGGFGYSGTDGKFFTFTEDHVPGTPVEVLPAPGVVAHLRELAAPGSAVTGEAWDGPLHDVDEDAVRKKFEALHTARPEFARRWDDDPTGLKDPSRSGFDFALVGYLHAAGFTYSETAAVMRGRSDVQSSIAEELRGGIDRQMRRAYGRAARSGEKPRVPADEEFGPVPDELLSKRAVPPEDRPPHAGANIHWISRTDWDAPDLDEFWRVDDVLPLEGIGVIYGDSGSGKTFLVLDMALCVASGRSWMGRDVEQCPVVYVASEGGPRTTRNRLFGWRQYWGQQPVTDFECAITEFNLSESGGSVIDAIVARGVAPGVVVIDTLARNFGGGDESGSQDMGRVVRSLVQIQRHFGCLVLVIHHSGKDAAKGARGSSSLRAAIDFEGEVSRKNGSSARLLKVTKMRDGEDGATLGFSLKSIELGESAKGKPIHTAVAVLDGTAVRLENREKSLEKRSDVQLAALDLLNRREALCQDHGTERWTINEWRDEVVRAVDAGHLSVKLGDSARRHLKSSLNSLAETGLPAVKIEGGRVRPAFTIFSDSDEA